MKSPGKRFNQIYLEDPWDKVKNENDNEHGLTAYQQTWKPIQASTREEAPQSHLPVSNTACARVVLPEQGGGPHT